MTTVSHHATKSSAQRLLSSPALRFLALLALCSAYIQGPLVKIFDFAGAQAEMTHFGLLPAPLFAVGVIVFELLMSALVLSASIGVLLRSRLLPSPWQQPSSHSVSGSFRSEWNAAWQ